MTGPSPKRGKAGPRATDSEASDVEGSTRVLGVRHPCLDSLLDWSAMMRSSHRCIAREKRLSTWASDPKNVSEVGRPQRGKEVFWRGESRVVAALGLELVRGAVASDDLSCVSFLVSSQVAVERVEGAGLGLVAKEDLTAGELVLVDRPVVSVMDQKLLAEDISDTEAVAAALMAKYPTLDALPSEIRNLHPLRDLQDDSKWQGAVTEAARLNSMGFYTFPELANSYEDRNRYLTGTAVYPVASMFNHSCSPNVSRASLGDLTWFRTSTDVKRGQQLTISYIGTDLLCEPRAVRQKHLARDFCCSCPVCSEEGDDRTEIIPFTLQERLELKMLEPSERLQKTAELLESQSGDRRFLAKECTNIMTERCRALLEIGQFPSAAEQWGGVLSFCQSHLPPSDPYLGEVAMSYVFAQVLAIATADDQHDSPEVNCPVDIRECLELAFGPFSAIKPFVVDEIEAIVSPVVGDDNVGDWVQQMLSIIDP
ncbi:hypothetical protein FOZ63_025515 [Perkinsus olseni]|uniref:SET domain-containing protein n=1 Tax=Perkinsus olseni TaxID=32597 RepID=A0A7J6QE46_PEROL|nr:hypothetical protein FOZ63_025515 [Perkinsus olseni]KAF4719296.1 hypothetical protein FOZ62_019017 [Perkinsus olseni]